MLPELKDRLSTVMAKNKELEQVILQFKEKLVDFEQKS